MGIVDLKKEGDVFILTMQSGENRFNLGLANFFVVYFLTGSL